MLHHSPIRLLPEHLIDQIKAGEVVERPAALIKEILENSLDAGATHLDLQIIDNGLNLISLEDNGKGMSYDDLPFAFARHATSKIYDYSDLFKLSSYGFRGEALASIASVSRLTCTSATSNGQGGKIEIHGGETISHTAIEGARQGTSLFVRDLFYNTPARLKFVKSKSVEKNALRRTIDAFLLTAPKASFTIRFDEKDKKMFSACSNELDFVKRIERIFFKKTSPAGNLLFESKQSFEGHEIHLYVSTQAIRGTNNKHQFLFANNRLFNDKRLHQTISRSLSALWGTESGHYACFLKVPSDQIDVNVHPNKIEVKFMREEVVFALLKEALKDLSSLADHTNQTEDISTSYNDYQQLKNINTDDPKNTQQVTKEISTSELPIGYRWHPSLANCILDESALVRFHYKMIGPLNLHTLTPLLINEPILCDENKLDLLKMNQFGFELESVDKNMLALRAIAPQLRPLPYVEMCKHALNHQERSLDTMYDDFELKNHLSLAILGRIIAATSHDLLIRNRIAFMLDKHGLDRIFSK